MNRHSIHYNGNSNWQVFGGKTSRLFKKEGPYGILRSLIMALWMIQESTLGANELKHFHSIQYRTKLL